jgi:hypothetical protein
MHKKSENNVRLAVSPEAHIGALCYKLRTMNTMTELHRMALKVCPDESHKTPPSLSYNASLTKGERKEQMKESKRYNTHQLLITDYACLHLPRVWLPGLVGLLGARNCVIAFSVLGSHVCDACSIPLSHCSRWEGRYRLCLFRRHRRRHLLPLVLLRLHHCTIRLGHTGFADCSAAT